MYYFLFFFFVCAGLGGGFGFNCHLNGVGGKMRNYNNPSSNLVNTLPDNLEIPCGKGSKLTKVIGGMSATPGEYPWATYLVIGEIKKIDITFSGYGSGCNCY